MSDRKRESFSLLSLRRLVEDALALSGAAAVAYAQGSRDWAAVVHAAAERSHCLILARIAGLSDGDADRIEPSVTILEKRLYRLWPLWKVEAASGDWGSPFRFGRDPLCMLRNRAG